MDVVCGCCGYEIIRDAIDSRWYHRRLFRDYDHRATPSDYGEPLEPHSDADIDAHWERTV